MNKQRRKELEKAIDLLSQAMYIVEAVKDEEQEAYDNLPDSLRDADKGNQMDTNIYNMDDSMETITSAMDTIQEVIDA